MSFADGLFLLLLWNDVMVQNCDVGGVGVGGWGNPDRNID